VAPHRHHRPTQTSSGLDMTPGSAAGLCRGSIRVRSGPTRCCKRRTRPWTDLPSKGEPMGTNLPPGIRQLPIYRAGLYAGQDIGLRIALDALTGERGRPERLGGSPACRVYAEGALLAVSKGC
jgi:hypothetical protein